MDDLNDERDKQLIKEREKYEETYFSQIVDEMIESDAIDKLIASRFEYIDNHFDFEPSPEYERLEELYYSQYESMDSSYVDDELQDYIPYDNLEDNFDAYDYPEGPDENLSGIKFEEYEAIYEPDFEEYCPEFEPDFEEPDSIDEYPDIPDEYYADLYEELMTEAFIEDYEIENARLDELIKEHIEDEKLFFDELLIGAMEEEFYFEKAIDELILEKIGIDYQPNFFDYENDDNWYYGSWIEDESIKDPFDSLGDIDYPEGEKTAVFDVPNNDYYVEYFESDFEVYEDDIDILEGLPEEDIPEPPQDFDLINEIDEPPEEIEENLRNEELIKVHEIFEEKFKEYINKNDNLNNIIKEKLQEKKFNK